MYNQYTYTCIFHLLDHANITVQMTSDFLASLSYIGTDQLLQSQQTADIAIYIATHLDNHNKLNLH